MIYNSNDLAGKVLGTCMLERLIGRGGMSAVYLAQQVRPSRQVAVKILLPNVSRGSSQHEKFLARFRNEADTVARLEHVNIIPIYEYNEQDGDAYLVMPYLRGGSLSALLARYGTLSLEETMVYMHQAAAALDYAHSQGVIHRDLKPGNFLLHSDNRLMLADFGIARIMQDPARTIDVTLTSPGLLLGTVDYMSPEMAQGEHIDYRSDIYELGIVLFQMLSGDVPFKGDTPYAILIKHLQEMPPLLHTMNPTIPPAVDHVIQKATAKRSGDRFASAGNLVQALQMAITQPHYALERGAHYAPTISAEPSLPIYQTTIATQAASLTNGNGEAHPYSSLPRTLTSIPGVSRRTWTMFIGICLVAFVALIISGVFFAFAQISTNNPQTSSKTPNTTPTLAQQAQAQVQNFYNDIDFWNYPAAYRLLSGDYCSFVNGYSYTLHDKATIGDVTELGGGKYSVAVTLKATELFPSGTVVSTYQGNEVIKHESDGSWKIVAGGNLPRIDRTPAPDTTPLIAQDAPPAQQAQAVIQQFYNDINQHNYPGAYSLWGSAYQSSKPYCSFIGDYAHTEHDDVTFNSITPLPDGTVKVISTISATEDGRSAPHRYQDSNIVGQDMYNSWKIQSGTQSVL